MLTKAKPDQIVISIVFTLSILFWVYLSFICQMYLWHDALGYEQLGRLLYNEGWIEYFKTGPNREPIYPWLVSISMHIAERLSTSYKTVQMFFQILILLWTQILVYKILKKLNIKTWLTALILLYIGFSPAMFISTFRLYSEIAAYPFFLLIILCNLKAWQSIHKCPTSGVGHGVLLGLSFLGATFVKGIVQLVVPTFLLLYISLAFLAFWKKQNIKAKHILLILLGIFIGFYIPLNTYKLANKIHNGNFTLTDRGPWALYGNTARRMEPLNMKRLLMAVTYVPRPEGCYKLFGKEDCQVWHYSESDKFGFGKLHELKKQNLSPKEIDKQLVRLSIKKALQNPFQYALFWILEGTKLFFWEFTSMAYVVYPTWMVNLFYFTPLHLGLNGLMALLSFASFLYIFRFCWIQKKDIFCIDKKTDTRTIISTSIFLLITGYIAAHCFFFVLPRYVFPIVPLYLISIALLIQRKSHD